MVKIKKALQVMEDFCNLFETDRLFLKFGVFRFELIDTTSSVDQFSLARIIRMRCARDL